MRRPSRMVDLYRWHRAALRGEFPPTHEDQPHCGWFRLRMVKGGPWCPARIWLHQAVDPRTGELTEPEEYRAEVLGEPRDPVKLWPRVARRPITREAWQALVAEHARNPRMAATHVAFDLAAETVRPA